jgi:hypothetical protein
VTAPSGAAAAALASASVAPSTVGASPSTSPAAISSRISTGTPPAACRSVATYRPPGVRLAITGVASHLATSSSIVSGTPASRAIASRCRMPLVDPPLAAIPAIAFSSALRSRNARAPLASRVASAPHAAASVARSASASAGTIVRPSGVMPRNSSARPIVFAVKFPAHVPGPGHATRSSSSSSARASRPWRVAPIASQTSWIVATSPCQEPARIGPL